jgi:hypothetical protein
VDREPAPEDAVTHARRRALVDIRPERDRRADHRAQRNPHPLVVDEVAPGRARRVRHRDVRRADPHAGAAHALPDAQDEGERHLVARLEVHEARDVHGVPRRPDDEEPADVYS